MSPYYIPVILATTALAMFLLIINTSGFMSKSSDVSTRRKERGEGTGRGREIRAGEGGERRSTAMPSSAMS